MIPELNPNEWTSIIIGLLIVILIILFLMCDKDDDTDTSLINRIANHHASKHESFNKHENFPIDE